MVSAKIGDVCHWRSSSLASALCFSITEQEDTGGTKRPPVAPDYVFCEAAESGSEMGTRIDYPAQQELRPPGLGSCTICGNQPPLTGGKQATSSAVLIPASSMA